MSFTSGDLGTQQMIQAERELDGRINFAFSKARELQAKIEEIDEKLAKDSAPPSAEEVDQFRTYVLSHARTDEWQVVTDRIDRGELSWRQIVEGIAENTVDRDVSAAFASLSKVPPATLDSLIASGVLPDPDAAVEQAPEEEDASPARPAAYGDDDDEWNEDQSIFRR